MPRAWRHQRRSDPHATVSRYNTPPHCTRYSSCFDSAQARRLYPGYSSGSCFNRIARSGFTSLRRCFVASDRSDCFRGRTCRQRRFREAGVASPHPVGRRRGFGTHVRHRHPHGVATELGVTRAATSAKTVRGTSRADIVEVSRAIIEDEGVEQLTIRRIAETINRTQPGGVPALFK